MLEAECGLTGQGETPGPSVSEGGTLWWLSQGTPRGSRGESEKDPLVALAGEGEDEPF